MKYLIIPAARCVWLAFRLAAASIAYLLTFLWTCNIGEASRAFEFLAQEDSDLIVAQFLTPIAAVGLLGSIYHFVQLWLNR